MGCIQIPGQLELCSKTHLRKGSVRRWEHTLPLPQSYYYSIVPADPAAWKQDGWEANEGSIHRAGSWALGSQLSLLRVLNKSWHEKAIAQPPACKLMEHVCSRTWSHTKSTMSLVWVCWTQEMPDCPLCWGQSILSNQLHVLSPAHITNENPSSPWQHLEWCTYSNPCLPADFWWTALTAFKCCAVPQWTTPLSTWQWDISLLFTDTSERVSWE